METESKNDGILENAEFPGVRLEQASLQLHITAHLKLASWEEEFGIRSSVRSSLVCGVLMTHEAGVLGGSR
jgi:hypothetical protein